MLAMITMLQLTLWVLQWVSVYQELSDEKFFYKLIYIYYMDIDEFSLYDGQMIDPISEYYGDFVAHLEFP